MTSVSIRRSFFRSIRAIFDRYLGWFSGQPSDLNRDSPRNRAQNLIDLGGGREAVFEKAQRAFHEGKCQWALELFEALSIDVEANQELKRWHCLTLEKLASMETSANGRNWLLTKSLEIQGLIDIKPSDKQRATTILKASLKNCLMLLTVNFNYHKAENVALRVLFYFKENHQKFLIEVRNSIVDIQESMEDANNVDLVIEWDNEQVWKEILIRTKTPMQAFDDETLRIKKADGTDYPEGLIQLLEFLLLFTP